MPKNTFLRPKWTKKTSKKGFQCFPIKQTKITYCHLISHFSNLSSSLHNFYYLLIDIESPLGAKNSRNAPISSGKWSLYAVFAVESLEFEKKVCLELCPKNLKMVKVSQPKWLFQGRYPTCECSNWLNFWGSIVWGSFNFHTKFQQKIVIFVGLAGCNSSKMEKNISGPFFKISQNHSVGTLE